MWRRDTSTALVCCGRWGSVAGHGPVPCVPEFGTHPCTWRKGVSPTGCLTKPAPAAWGAHQSSGVPDEQAWFMRTGMAQGHCI